MSTECVYISTLFSTRDTFLENEPQERHRSQCLSWCELAPLSAEALPFFSLPTSVYFCNYSFCSHVVGKFIRFIMLSIMSYDLQKVLTSYWHLVCFPYLDFQELKTCHDSIKSTVGFFFFKYSILLDVTVAG